MKTLYYKPTGDAMTAAIDWLISRKTVLAKWDKFAARYVLETGDLLTEQGVVIGLKDEPPARLPFDFNDKLAKLPALPNATVLADMLGLPHGCEATAIKTRGGVVVKSAIVLKGQKPLNEAVLAKDYGIRVVVGECRECGLPLSYNELECGRCGTRVQPEQKEVNGK